MELQATFVIGNRGRTVDLPFGSEEELLIHFGLDENSEPDFGIEDSTLGLLDGAYHFSEYRKINEFAEQIEEVDQDVMEALQEYCGKKFTDILDNVENFGDVHLYSDCDSDRAIGREMFESVGGVSGLSKEKLEIYFDYEAFGRDVRLERKAGITSKGYLEIS